MQGAGARLKEIRQKIGLTQHDLGLKIGLSQPKVKNIETGIQKMTVEIADTIANNLAIDAWWLLTGKGSMYLDDTHVTGISHNNGIIVAGNTGNISVSIDRDDFKDDSADIEELISLLRYAPKSFIMKVNEKLRAFRDLAEI